MSDRPSGTSPAGSPAGDARRLLAFLAELDRALASAPEPDFALQDAARVVVPAFAEWCLIHRLDEGAARVAAVEHADPQRTPWARRAGVGIPFHPEQGPGLADVFRSGPTQYYPEIPQVLLAEAARVPGQLEALRQAGFRSCIIAPLHSRGELLGALSLVVGESAAPYGEPELRLADEVARRLAAALDRARLLRMTEGVQRERRQAAEGLRAIAARARCLLWYADVEDRGHRILHWMLRVADEEAARRFLPVEVPPGYTYGQALAEARLPEDRARMAWGDEEVRAGRSYGQEFRIRDSHGEIRWLAEEVQIEAAGPNRWNAVGICVDISERKRMEEELREQAAALGQADQRKDEFLAMLAHELRNPLGAITNSLYVLQQPDAGGAARARALSVLDRQVRHQSRMVEDLLDVSRISRGKVQLRQEPLDLAALARDTIEDYRPAFQSSGVELDLSLPERPLVLLGDRVRLSQVLGNLLNNALKFTPVGKRVTVSVARAAAEAVLRIQDTGVGIPAELLPHVFDSFTQGDRSLARTQGGLGLGLALVRGLVQLHGGAVSAGSGGPGEGSEFTLRFPLAEGGEGSADAPSAAPEAPGAAGGAGLESPCPEATAPGPGCRRVLVVEDNLDAATTMRDLLELVGHRVELAHTGPEGIMAARRCPPDVVLCDIGLPGMDGYAVAAALREDPRTAAARIIAISGYGQERDRQRSHEAGFDAHLVKPIAPQTLYDLLGPG